MLLLVKLGRAILNLFRHPDCKGQPMTKDEAVALIKERAREHPEGATLDTSKSIVDALKALYLDSSFPGRARLAHGFGMTDNYTGTAEQNLWLLDRYVEHIAAEGNVESLR